MRSRPSGAALGRWLERNKGNTHGARGWPHRCLHAELRNFNNELIFIFTAKTACESRMRKSGKLRTGETRFRRPGGLTLIYGYQTITYWFGNGRVTTATIPRFCGLFSSNLGLDRPLWAINQAAMPKG